VTLTFDPIDPKIKSNGPRIITNHPTEFHAIRFNNFCVMRITRIQINKYTAIKTLPSHFQCEGNNINSNNNRNMKNIFLKTLYKKHNVHSVVNVYTVLYTWFLEENAKALIPVGDYTLTIHLFGGAKSKSWEDV